MSATRSAIYGALKARFAAAGIETPGMDARLLLSDALGIDTAGLIARGEEPVEAERRAHIETLAGRRIAGEPVHRILGKRAFFGLSLHLSADTLEPRPDTETLVDAVLPHARDIVARTGKCRILDLGTGTGAICLACLQALPQAQGVGSDIAPGALAAARRNAAENGLSDRFTTVESDWFAAVSGRFDMVLSNPPYIRQADMADLPREVYLFDPPRALDGGEDGLTAYRVIAAGAADHLEDGGIVGLEIGSDQAEAVRNIFNDAGFRCDGVFHDLAGRPRALILHKTV